MSNGSRISAMFSNAIGGSNSSMWRCFSGNCSHCDIKGNKWDNCYRLIDFPSDFKFNKKKGVQAAMTVNLDSFSVDSSPFIGSGGSLGFPLLTSPVFAQDQYNQILNLLSKPVSTDSAVNLAGIGLSCLPANDSVSWILDTRATDHILSDFKFLIDPIPCPHNSHFDHFPHGKSIQLLILVLFH